MATSDRPLRGCNLCGGYDDHPRHVQTVDGRPFLAHIDCCAANGCETCAETEEATGGLRGSELIDHLNSTRETTNG